VDLLMLDELDRLHDRPWFIRFTYDGEELAHAETLSAERRREFLAARFAAKEAVLKVLGTGLFQGVLPRDIAVIRGHCGAPDVRLLRTAARAAARAGIRGITVSITHKRDLVTAVALGW
jgi:holo-[acyl-carrier protein] synthase